MDVAIAVWEKEAKSKRKQRASFKKAQKTLQRIAMKMPLTLQIMATESKKRTRIKIVIFKNCFIIYLSGYYLLHFFSFLLPVKTFKGLL